MLVGQFYRLFCLVANNGICIFTGTAAHQTAWVPALVLACARLAALTVDAVLWPNTMNDTELHWGYPALPCSHDPLPSHTMLNSEWRVTGHD